MVVAGDLRGASILETRAASTSEAQSLHVLSSTDLVSPIAWYTLSTTAAPPLAACLSIAIKWFTLYLWLKDR